MPAWVRGRGGLQSATNRHLITDELFETVLLKPAKDLKGFKGLKDISLDIVSGYAEVEMAKRHMRKLDDNNTPVSSIRVVVGMDEIRGTEDLKYFAKKYDLGCLKKRNLSWRTISSQKYHAKVYVWLAGGVPLLAFSGSANYTKAAFNVDGHSSETRQMETMVEINSADEAHQFFEKAWCQGKPIG